MVRAARTRAEEQSKHYVQLIVKLETEESKACFNMMSLTGLIDASLYRLTRLVQHHQFLTSNC